MSFSGGGEFDVGRRDEATVAACDNAPAGVGRRVRGISMAEILFRAYALSTAGFMCNATAIVSYTRVAKYDLSSRRYCRDYRWQDNRIAHYNPQSQIFSHFSSFYDLLSESKNISPTYGQ